VIVSTLVMVILTGVAAYTDATRHKIYNWTTYPGILAGFAVHVWESGSSGMQDSIAGFLVCGVMMLVCFVCFPDLGGGDVKLIAMLGAGLGVWDGILAMLWTFVTGFVAGLSYLIWKEGAWRLGQRTAALIREAIVMRGRVTRVEGEQSPLHRWLFLGPAALAAVVAVRWQVLIGTVP
jgi:prepilin peptidase CpaA